MVRQCTAITRDGSRCRGTPLPGKVFCFAHDPDLAGTRAAAAAAGGRNKANRARARKRVLAAGLSLDEVDGALCQALLDVLDGTIEPGVATAAATVARSITAVRQAGEIEQRIAALEQAAGVASDAGLRRLG
jgi:hypothetical protein